MDLLNSANYTPSLTILVKWSNVLLSHPILGIQEVTTVRDDESIDQVKSKPINTKELCFKGTLDTSNCTLLHDHLPYW